MIGLILVLAASLYVDVFDFGQIAFAAATATAVGARVRHVLAIIRPSGWPRLGEPGPSCSPSRPKKGNNDNDNDEASIETIPEREMGEKTWEMEKEIPRAHMLDTENAMLLNTK